jgi:hypothetical protein
MKVNMRLRSGEVVMVDTDHLPFTLTVQQQINSAISRSYMTVIDALAELGAKEIARRNAIKSAKSTLAVDDTSGGWSDG